MNRMTVIAALAPLMGCTVGPHYTRPLVTVPAAYVNTASGKEAANIDSQVGGIKTPNTGATASVDYRWWRVFQDAELDSLVERAGAANLDLQQATARVLEARANVGIARAGVYPDSNLTGNATRNRQRFFVGLTPDGHPNLRALELNDFRFNFDASWELDLWGRVRSGYRAAQADKTAQEQDRRDVLVTVLSEIARNYTELRGSQLRLQIAKKNQQDERDIVELTKVRAAAGLASERDVAQAKSALAALEATVPPLEAAYLVSLHRLSVLTGQPPEALRSKLAAAAPLPKTSAAITAGLPSTLLQRRPDIRRAEAQLVAATLRIGVAKADFFPRFTLTASGGRDASQFRGLSIGGNNIFGVGPTFSLPLFNANRIRSNVDLERARTDEAAARFKASVLNALEETENALARHNREQDRLLKLREEALQNQAALDLSQVQYKAGLADFTTVLTAERDLQSAQDQVAQSEIAVTTNLIAVYKALGGGWEIAPSTIKP